MRLFYADEATPAAGGETIDIAAQLAKVGVRTSEEGGEVPNIVVEEKKVPETIVPETKATSVEVPTITEKQGVSKDTTAAPVAYNWKEELKRAEITEVLKELGFDEKLTGLVNTWRGGGDMTNYLKAALVDYSKMSPEQLLRQDLADEYPEFSPEDLEELYRAKVIDHYKLDPDVNTEQEVKRGKLLLLADSKKIREGLITKQKDFILNVKPPETPNPYKDMEATILKQEEDRKQTLAQYKAAFDGHQATKDLLSNKRLVIGEGEEVFNYEVADPNKVLTILQDPVQWAQTIFNADGTPQIEKQLAMSAVAIDHAGLFREIFKAGKAQGGKQALEQLENAKKPGAQTAGPEVPLTPAQALARFGINTAND